MKSIIIIIVGGMLGGFALICWDAINLYDQHLKCEYAFYKSYPKQKHNDCPLTYGPSAKAEEFFNWIAKVGAHGRPLMINTKMEFGYPQYTEVGYLYVLNSDMGTYEKLPNDISVRITPKETDDNSGLPGWASFIWCKFQGSKHPTHH